MKRIFALLLCLALLIACVPTPEEDAVKQKNTSVLIDTVKDSEQAQNAEGMPTLPPVKTQMPERFTCSFTTDDGATVEGDVPLRVLTDGVFPVLRVERRTLTNAERLTLAGRFLGTDELYLYQQVFSRKSVEDIIRNLMEEPPIEQWRRDEYTQEEIDDLIEYRKEQLAYWQEYYRRMPTDDSAMPLARWDGSAPERLDETSPGEIVTESEGRTNLAFLPHVSLYPDRSSRMMEYCNPTDEQNRNVNAFSFNITSKPGVERIEPKDYDVVHDGATVTPRAAANAVLPYFEGLVDLQIDDIYWSNNADTDGEGKGQIGTYGYLVRLTPVVDGAAMPYVGSDAWADYAGDADWQVAPEWPYERAVAAVSPDGVLVSVFWWGAAKVTGTIAKTTTLLPFDEVMRLFTQQMNRRLFGRGVMVRVTGVKLGLFRIREQNSMETGLLVPAWVITGTCNAKGDERELDPLCVINAVDGSIIDAHKGY